MATAQQINAQLVANIEAAPNVPAMREAWAPIQVLDSFSGLALDRVGSFCDGAVIFTRTQGGDDHTVRVGDFSYRTELVIEAMRNVERANRADAAADAQEQPIRRGRPPVGTPLQVRLGHELQERVDGYAEEHSLSRANAVRQLLHAGLDSL